jgi:hypothetical protein
MAFDLKIQKSIVRITFKGFVDSRDLESLDELISKIEAEREVTPDRLSDLSFIKGVKLTCTALEEFTDKRRQAILKNRVKSAIVVPRLLQYGIARMYQTLNDNPKIHSRIFTDKSRALKWLTSGKSSGTDAA